MGKKPITINDPNPVNFETQDIKIEDEESKNIIEFDDVEENIPEIEQQITEINTDNHEIEKILIVYTDKTFEIIKPRH